jgi:hypothetical protein
MQAPPEELDISAPIQNPLRRPTAMCSRIAILSVENRGSLRKFKRPRLQRTVPDDGTLIEGSAMMSPLWQAAQAHFVEEEMRQLAGPKTEPAPEPSAPPPPAVIAIINQDKSAANTGQKSSMEQQTSFSPKRLRFFLIVEKSHQNGAES